MEQKLTAKQEQILDYLKECILKKGYPPAVREICDAVDLKSTSSVHSHLETLEKKGYIRRDPTKPRAIEICDDSFQMVRTEMVSIPVLGNVAASSGSITCHIRSFLFFGSLIAFLHFSQCSVKILFSWCWYS